MPRDEYALDDEEDKRPRVKRDASGFLKPTDQRYEFDCPQCEANNPYPDGFGDGDGIVCHYCGQEYRVIIEDEGRLKLKAV